MRPGFLALPILLAIMSLMFGDGLIGRLGLSPSLHRSLVIVAAIVVVLLVAISLGDVVREKGLAAAGVATFFETVVLVGFAYDLISTIVGTETLLRADRTDHDFLRILFAILVAALLFAVTMIYEKGFSGDWAPTWAYGIVFVVAMFFDVLTSVIGFHQLFGVEKWLSIETGLLAFTSILVFGCQFGFLQIYVKGVSPLEIIR